MNLFYQPNLPEEKFLDVEESKHCVKALRMKSGDTIEVIDGKGTLYNAIITNASHKKCEFEITDTVVADKFPMHRHIAIAPTKNIDRIEWFVEKAVEIGIDEISFLLCKHSERKVLKIDRIVKKAISAMKQSYKFWMPKFNDLQTLEKFISQKREGLLTIAYVDFDNPKDLSQCLNEKPGASTVLIGPEGDFSKEEILLAQEHNYNKVSLGKSRLRTETAGIVACHLMTISQ